jgi:hypothetical protein
MRRFVPILVLGLLIPAACGAVLPATGSDASSSRSASPPAPSPAPSTVLQSGNCTGSPSTSPNSTPKTSLGMDSIELTIPPGWSDQTSGWHGEAVLLRVQAPVSYGSDDATFMLVAIPGPRQGSSAREQATEDANVRASLGQQSSVNDCNVGGESAAFYSYRDSRGMEVYRILVLRSPHSKYPFLYSVEISSQGQIDARAAADVRGILGSWTWGPPKYDPNT